MGNLIDEQMVRQIPRIMDRSIIDRQLCESGPARPIDHKVRFIIDRQLSESGPARPIDHKVKSGGQINRLTMGQTDPSCNGKMDIQKGG